MGTGSGRRTARRFGWLAMLVLTACGVSSQVIPPFVEGVIGTGGGTVQTQTVRLELPPGALLQDTVVRILPQPTPLPIDPLAGPIAYMPGLMCIGPIGQGLAVQARVRVCYDPLAIPAGSTENDLVLLEWDDFAGLMRVSQTAIQDFLTHCFTDNVYFTLGHIGVGVRTGPPFAFVFPGGPPAPPILAPVTGQGGFQPPQLHLADTAGAVVPQALPSSVNAELPIPSRAGDRVMYTLFDSPTESTFLASADVSGGGQRSLLGPNDQFLWGDRFIGWLEDDTALFVETSRFDGEQFSDVLRIVGGGGAPAPADLVVLPPGFFLTDLRISPDGSLILVRLTDTFSKGSFELLQTYDAVTGELVGTDLPGLPFTFSSPMPRWLPDSSGLYWVDPELNEVDCVDADGMNPLTLFELPMVVQFDTIIDFVLSPTTWTGGTPSTAKCAYVRRSFGEVVVGAGLQVGPHDLLTISSLDGTGLVETDLGGTVVVNELVYHPNGAVVFGDFSPSLQDVGLDAQAVIPGFGETVQMFHGTTAALLRTVVSSLADFDVDRVDGRVLVWIQGQLQDPLLTEPGLYVLPSDVSTATSVPLGSLLPIGPARFLHTWRRCPGSESSGVR